MKYESRRAIHNKVTWSGYEETMFDKVRKAWSAFTEKQARYPEELLISPRGYNMLRQTIPKEQIASFTINDKLFDAGQVYGMKIEINRNLPDDVDILAVNRTYSMIRGHLLEARLGEDGLKYLLNGLAV